MNSPIPPDTTTDALLDGRLVLRQPARGHRAGTDAVLLASAVAAEAGMRIADFGAGVGTVALLLRARCPGVKLTLVEIDPGLAALARENAAHNGGAVEVLAGDVATAHVARQSFDHVVMNPPFHPEAGRASPDPATDRARREDGDVLRDWLAAAAKALRPGGVVTLIHRADALARICAELQRARFGALTLVPVHPSADKPATRLLAAGRLGSRAPLCLLPPLILHDGGGFTNEARALHGGAAMERPMPVPGRVRAARSSRPGNQRQRRG